MNMEEYKKHLMKNIKISKKLVRLPRKVSSVRDRISYSGEQQRKLKMVVAAYNCLVRDLALKVHNKDWWYENKSVYTYRLTDYFRAAMFKPNGEVRWEDPGVLLRDDVEILIVPKKVKEAAERKKPKVKKKLVKGSKSAKEKMAALRAKRNKK